MSNPFYKYLSEKIITYFQINKPSQGDKFYIQFENDSQVNELYKELRENTISNDFLYEDSTRNQSYLTYQLNFGEVQLIIAAAMEGGIHPDFLATLRNLVGLERGYENKAILFIHCSSLDSILGGAGSLCKEGMPLNILEIEKDIKHKIDDNGYSEIDKTILKQYLNNKSKELIGGTVSVFEYEDIICALTDSQITEKEYRKFNLFYDPALSSFSGKKLNDRLLENNKNYNRVSEIHSYGADEAQLEKYYGENGAKVLKKPDWEDTSYSDVLKYLSSKKNDSSIEYIPIMSNILVWDKEEGTTKSKTRIRNIIIFVTSEDTFKFTLSFTDFTKKTGIDIPKIYQSKVKCESSGKKLNVELLDIEDQAAFYHLKYDDDGTKFEFKIAALRCHPSMLESIKTQYSIEAKGGVVSAIRINSDEDTFSLNEFGSVSRTQLLSEENQVVTISSDENITFTVSEDYPYSEDNEDVSFSISIDGFVIPMIKAFAIEKPTVIEGLKLWYLKNTKRISFEKIGDNSLAFGTKRYFTRDEFKRSLELEKKYIQNGTPFAVEKSESSSGLEPVDVSLPSEVVSTFNDIISYFVKHDTLPSLTSLDDELKDLYARYLTSIKAVIESFKDGDYLSDVQRNVFYFGMIKKEYGDYEILLTPLHPINIAYQLYINSQNIEGLEDAGVDLLRKFQHTSLLPYINIDPFTSEKKVYIPVEQVYAPEWKIYVEESLPRYKGSKDFVSKLVAEKIREFVEHFSYLFSEGSYAPLRINLVNTGDCREVVQGIIKYYIQILSKSNIKNVIPIRVTMYSDSKMDTMFGLMSQVDDPDVLGRALGIEMRSDITSLEDVIDVYRDNVHFYYKSMDEFEYAHITFLELDDDNQEINTLMKDIPTGITMNGISSGVSSEFLGDSYRTGFGMKYADISSDLIDIAVKLNSVNAAINGDSYREGSAYALKMSVGKKQILDKIYDASNWVTFINPKVDLNYFKSDLSTKDLLIIHYSDQYNLTSSGYDAITVTRKSKQYQNAIMRYLDRNGVEEADMHSRRIINMFNALNGDWLLRMLSYKSHFPLEKLSILSAMKLAIKRYAVSGVIWVPVSLEEILRVSGSVGLSQNTIFSAKGLGFEGSTSDDLLLVGIRPGEKVQVTFYPIEVKIGKVESDYLEKGIKQATKTRQIFDEILGFGSCLDKPMKMRLYRNFFIQQVLVNAGKMQLYDVGDGTQGWETVTDSDLRRKLLSEQYEIVDSLIPEMGKAGVISFREECSQEKEERNNEVLIVEKSKNDGVNLLAKDFSEIEVVDWSLVKQLDNDTTENESFSETNGLNENGFEEDSKTADYDEEISEQFEYENTAEAEKPCRVLIGKDRYSRNVYWEYGNKALANRHLLITGTSGQGKTYSIQAMLYELSKEKISSVIFDYTEGFMLQQLEQPFKDSLGDKICQRIIYSEGVPINPFQRHEVDLAGNKILEKESDVAARLADIFVHVYDFGAQQYSAIFDAALSGMKEYGDGMNMHIFQDKLKEISEDNKAAKSVISKMSPFFNTVDFNNASGFDWGNVLYAEDAKVNIIQLTLFSREMQVIITEMMLWDAWYYTKKYGSKDKPFVVVLDEAQNLSHTMKSPSAAILTEGRKFGWSAWFATQSLKVLKDDEVVRLLQAAFKLYFKPTDDEMVRVSRQLDAAGSGNWISEIQKLKKGQCIAVGDKMKANGTVGPAEPVVTSISSFEER